MHHLGVLNHFYPSAIHVALFHTRPPFLPHRWRVGWVCVHDRGGALADVRRGLFALSQLILGANSPVVAALPAVLTPAPGSVQVRGQKHLCECVVHGSDACGGFWPAVERLEMPTSTR